MHRARNTISKLLYVATVGTMFQATGCTVDTAGLASSFLTTFINFAINNFVNAQLGVSNLPF